MQHSLPQIFFLAALSCLSEFFHEVVSCLWFGFGYISTGATALSVPDAERLSLYREKRFPTEATRPNSIVDSGPSLVALRQLGSPAFFQVSVTGICLHCSIHSTLSRFLSIAGTFSFILTSTDDVFLRTLMNSGSLILFSLS